MTLHLLFLIMSFVFSILATIGAPGSPRFNWLAAAFTFFIASLLFGEVVIHG